LSTENFCFSTRFFHFAGGAHETCRDLYTGKTSYKKSIVKSEKEKGKM